MNPITKRNTTVCNRNQSTSCYWIHTFKWYICNFIVCVFFIPSFPNPNQFKPSKHVFCIENVGIVSSLWETKRWQNGNHWANTIVADISDKFGSFECILKLPRGSFILSIVLLHSRIQKKRCIKMIFSKFSVLCSPVAADGTKRKLSKRVFDRQKKYYRFALLGYSPFQSFAPFFFQR